MAADEITISLGLPGYRVTQQRPESEPYDSWVEPTATAAVCPRCGQPSTADHDCYERTVRDLPILGRAVYLHMVQRRFKCVSCGKPLTNRRRWLTGNSDKPVATNNTSCISAAAMRSRTSVGNTTSVIVWLKGSCTAMQGKQHAGERAEVLDEALQTPEDDPALGQGVRQIFTTHGGAAALRAPYD